MNGGAPRITSGEDDNKPTKAQLDVCILSAYDLPHRDPPISVQVSVGLKSVMTGPPAQRHKDRNSFKFPRDIVSLKTPTLPELYQNQAKIEAVYQNHPNLVTYYDLSNLKIHETVWLILQLEEESGIVDDDEVPPTLRLQLTLSGPYRPEVALLVSSVQKWFHLVDAFMETSEKVTSKLPDRKFLLLPAAPVVAVLVVSAPVLAGVTVVTLPVALPVLIVLGVLFGALLCGGCFVYGSTETGRGQVGGVLAPLYNTVVSTKTGQSLVYCVGDRPTPVGLAKMVAPSGVWQKLLLSLVIDGLGSASYLLPLIGEVTDIAWAPIQTTLILALYDQNQYSEALKYTSMVEELLPFTDIVPTATIGWCLDAGLPLLAGKKPLKPPMTTSLVSQSPALNTPAFQPMMQPVPVNNY